MVVELKETWAMVTLLVHKTCASLPLSKRPSIINNLPAPAAKETAALQILLLWWTNHVQLWVWLNLLWTLLLTIPVRNHSCWINWGVLRPRIRAWSSYYQIVRKSSTTSLHRLRRSRRTWRISSSSFGRSSRARSKTPVSSLRLSTAFLTMIAIPKWSFRQMCRSNSKVRSSLNSNKRFNSTEKGRSSSKKKLRGNAKWKNKLSSN